MPLPPITPSQRQRLQKLWEEARGIMARAGSPPGRKDAERIHGLLAECVAADPGNTVYLDAFLVNLRQLPPRVRPGIITSILSRDRAYQDFERVHQQINYAEMLRLGPAALRESILERRVVLLMTLARCVAGDFPEAEIRYLQEGLHLWPREEWHLLLGRTLIREGRFSEAYSHLSHLRDTECFSQEVRSFLKILDGPTSEQDQTWSAALPGLQSAASQCASAHNYLALADCLARLLRFDEAEAAAAKALSLSGGDLKVREQTEEIALVRLKNNVAVARRLVEYQPNEAYQQTLRRWEEELGRLELATHHARSERFPQDAGLKLEVAIRLKRAGNYSGAIQRLEEIPANSPQRATALVELGENWQHLRQFDKALDFYRQAVAAAEEHNQSESLKLALYRAGCLATAMNQTSIASGWLQRLLQLDSGFKDVREQWRNLDATASGGADGVP